MENDFKYKKSVVSSTIAESKNDTSIKKTNCEKIDTNCEKIDMEEPIREHCQNSKNSLDMDSVITFITFLNFLGGFIMTFGVPYLLNRLLDSGIFERNTELFPTQYITVLIPIVISVVRLLGFVLVVNSIFKMIVLSIKR